MPNYNKVILAGHLTRDIEVKYLDSGTAVANVGMAVNNRVKRGDEWTDEPCFIEIALWGRNAENASKYLEKGSAILVDGNLKLDQWEDRDGNKRSRHSVNVQTMQFLPKGGSSKGGGDSGGRNYPVDDEDNIPF
jgi:single-strand DNA-binding protein